MPLVEFNSLPTYQRLRQEGHAVLTPERAKEQDIRGLHIGLLNMMPDAALAATERQFFRLIGSSNPISQFFIHPFTLDEIPRGEVAAEHVARYYEPLESIKEHGLDALIITGANVTQPDLSKEVFWEPLSSVFNWARENVTSTLCSCLASHAVLLNEFGIARESLAEKCWGVFEHDVVQAKHPLVHDVNTRLFVPHSRFNRVTAQQLQAHGLHVLIEGAEPGVQLAVSPDGFRTVYFQGHPEYDRVSLMKEYKRDIGLYIHGKRGTYPPMPQHYFDHYTQVLLEEYADIVEAALQSGIAVPLFPESHVFSRLHNTWHDSGEAIVGNWIGLVYQITNNSIHLPFMDGVDPSDPLGFLQENGLG